MWAINRSLLHNVQTGCGALPALYIQRIQCAGLKWPSHDHSSPSGAEIKKDRAVILLSDTPSWRDALRVTLPVA